MTRVLVLQGQLGGCWELEKSGHMTRGLRPGWNFTVDRTQGGRMELLLRLHGNKA